MINITFDPLQQHLKQEMQSELAKMCMHSQWMLPQWITMSSAKTPKQGIYLHGAVGRGKTTLIHSLFDNVQYTKKRFHFDTFFANLHQSLENQTLQSLAKSLGQDYKVIWIDELQIYDVATAMLIKRFIPALFHQHMIVLMTGNIAPDDFYKGGLSFDQFKDFIPYFLNTFHCYELDGKIDYRYVLKNDSVDVKNDGSELKGDGSMPLDDHMPSHGHSFQVVSQKANSDMMQIFRSIAPEIEPVTYLLALNQRQWTLKSTLPSAVFIDFDELALDDHAFDDYRRLVETFAHIFVINVPVFDEKNQDACRRFMSFVDILYDEGAKLYMTAFTHPSQIYQDKRAKLPFERTLSRLNELLFR